MMSSTVATRLAAADLPPIASPDIQYSLLMPLFIVAGVAVVGVLVEAFCPRRQRFTVQVTLACVGIVAALADSVWVFQHLDVVKGPQLARGQIAAEGAVAVDGPGVFAWGILLVFALMSMLLFAERRLEGGLSSFTGRASDAPPARLRDRAPPRGPVRCDRVLAPARVGPRARAHHQAHRGHPAAPRLASRRMNVLTNETNERGRALPDRASRPALSNSARRCGRAAETSREKMKDRD